MEQNIITGRCSKCGKEIPVEYLSFLPETEEFYRSLDLNKNTEIPANVDSKIMLCPSCMTAYEQSKNG